MREAGKTNSLETTVRRQLREHDFHRLLVTVSGGADSVCILAALSSCRYLSLIAAHCNFHLRGEESMRDQNFVSDLCRSLGVPLMVKDFDVEGYISSRRGVSVEMACRELRYEWFRQLLSDTGSERIVTGHNADDNVETMLINLFRGSGTNGLKGMSEDSGEIWRPLLSIHRKDILAYLKERNLSYITDSSNLESDYRRNFIRNEILPMLRSRWKGLDKALDRSLSHIAEESKIVQDCIIRNLPPEGSPLSRDTVLSFPAPDLLVRRYIEPVAPFATTASEVVAAMKADKSDIRRWRVRNGGLVLRAGKLYLVDGKQV